MGMQEIHGYPFNQIQLRVILNLTQSSEVADLGKNFSRGADSSKRKEEFSGYEAVPSINSSALKY